MIHWPTNTAHILLGLINLSKNKENVFVILRYNKNIIILSMATVALTALSVTSENISTKC